MIWNHWTSIRRGTSLLVGTILLGFSPLFLHAQTPAQGEDSYAIRPIDLPPQVRPERKYDRQQLPFKKFGGTLPTHDGDRFHLNVYDAKVTSREDAERRLQAFIEGMKSNLQMQKEIRFGSESKARPLDMKMVDQEIRNGKESTQKRLSGEHKTVSKSSTDMIDEEAQSLRKQAANPASNYRFDQYWNDVRIDYAGLTFTQRGQEGLLSLQGRFYDEVKPSNAQKLEYQRAVAMARVALLKANSIKEIKFAEQGQVVLLPYADGFKYAWKSTAIADGPYTVWIDAENGQVLHLHPEFQFDTGSGLRFNPNPTMGTVVQSFEVDPAVGGQFSLKLAGVLEVISSNADGCAGNVTVATATPDFNVAPINSTTNVQTQSGAGYNCQFQQVNAYATIWWLREYWQAIGSQTFPMITANVDEAGNSNFYDGAQAVHFSIGNATMGSTSSICPVVDKFSGAIDATCIAHEFGHFLNKIQRDVSGNSMHGALNEGLGDFWANTMFNTDTFGGWYGQLCPPTQTGYLPRQAEATDVFPDRFSAGGSITSIHSSGQVTSWANWRSRQGMNELMKFGSLSININMVQALTSLSAVSLGTNDLDVHDANLDLLEQLAPLYSESRLINKLLSGYARAGIFLAEKDAVIDISDSYLDRDDLNGPTFFIWTGRDYVFSGTTADTGTQPFNTEFQVDVANDVAFTSNLVSSGWLGGVTATSGGTATWTLPEASWNTLKAGDNLYYRVTTRAAGGGDERQSWNPGNSTLLDTPVGKAAINGSGQIDCSCSASSGNNTTGMALLPILPLLGLVIYRFSLRRKQKSDASKDH